MESQHKVEKGKNCRAQKCQCMGAFHFISFLFRIICVQCNARVQLLLCCIVSYSRRYRCNPTNHMILAIRVAVPIRIGAARFKMTYQPTDQKKKRHTAKYTKEERKLKSQAIQSQPSLALLPSPFQPPLTSFFFRF